MPRVLLIVALVVVGIPAVLYAFWVTHIMLSRLCVRHARRFCSRSGLQTRRARWQPEFEASGVKTEFTLVQLDCLDAQKQRRLVLLSVWPLGVRETVSDERIQIPMTVSGHKFAPNAAAPQPSRFGPNPRLPLGRAAELGRTLTCSG
jgi:hypothetical protein